MSRVVEAFPSKPWAKYPWDQWLDGRIHELQRGQDFDVLPQRVAHAAYNWAERKGLTVRTEVRGDCLYLQAISLGAEAAE